MAKTLNKPKSLSKSKVQAVILYADIFRSGRLFTLPDLELYNKLIRLLHQISEQTINDYCEREQIIPEQIYHRALGDEVLVCFLSGDTAYDLKHALDLALLLRGAWALTDFNQLQTQTRGFITELQFGIGEGFLITEPSVWQQGATPEGFALSQTKWIQREAGNRARFTKIAIKASLEKTLKELNLELAIQQSVKIHPFGIDPIEILPLKSYYKTLGQHLCATLPVDLPDDQRQLLMFLSGHFDNTHYLHHYFRAGETFRNDEHETAYKHIKKCLKLNPDFSQGFYLQGKILEYSHKLNSAIKAYRQSISQKDVRYFHYHALSKALEQTGQLVEALEMIAKARELQPEEPLLICDEGDLRLARGQTAEATKLYQQAIKLNQEFAEAYHRMGQLFERTNESQKAIAEYQKAIELKPEEPAFRLNLGRVLEQSGELAEAIKVCEEVIILKPNTPSAYHQLGLIYLKQDHPKLAKEALCKAIELDPNNPQIHLDLGMLSRKQGHLDKALKSLKQAVEIEPQNHHFHFLLGSIFDERGYYDEAILEYGRAIDLKPDAPAYLSSLGRVFTALGEWDRAIKLGLKASRLDPADADVHSFLGTAFAHKGETEQAITKFEEAIRLKPGDPEIYRRLGELYIKENRLDEAIGALSKARELTDQHE